VNFSKLKLSSPQQSSSQSSSAAWRASFDVSSGASARLIRPCRLRYSLWPMRSVTDFPAVDQNCMAALRTFWLFRIAVRFLIISESSQCSEPCVWYGRFTGSGASKWNMSTFAFFGVFLGDFLGDVLPPLAWLLRSKELLRSDKELLRSKELPLAEGCFDDCDGLSVSLPGACGSGILSLVGRVTQLKYACFVLPNSDALLYRHSLTASVAERRSAR